VWHRFFPPNKHDRYLMTIAQQKDDLRALAKKQRSHAVAHAGSEADTHFTEHLLSIAEKIGISSGTVIGGYWAMSNELSVTAGMLALIEQYGATCALPVVVAPETPLVFRQWTPGMVLDQGGFGTAHPPESAAPCMPDVLLIPLLAFDLTGYRLGWGGGFYDRTLAKFKSEGRNTIAVGAAYEGQHMDRVLHDDLDQPVDWIVTEQYVHEVKHP
jgi:5-formyltetrahydrofolate cyclo-ligase